MKRNCGDILKLNKQSVLLQNKVYMKNHYLLLAFFIYSFNNVHAQLYKKKTMHTGETIASASTYLFPAFTNAMVKLKNGGVLYSAMNFNLLICEMQFIGADKDTLVLTKPEEIDSIIFANGVFFFNKGFYQILASSDSVKLAVLRRASYEPVKIGALGISNYSGTGTQSYTSIVTHAGSKNLVINEDINIITETAYFLIKNNKEMIKVNKPGFIKVFPSKEPDIQTYLKQNKIDFNKEADLKKLFAFLMGNGS
jgi:hypothetical protein